MTEKEINKHIWWAYDYLKDKGFKNRANRLLKSYLSAKREVIDDVKKMVNDCIKKGLATEFILLQGIPTIEKRHLSTFPKEKQHNSGLKKDRHQS